MLLIKQHSNMSVTIAHAGQGVGGLTQVVVNIPLDINKYLKGDNLIDSIVPQSLPDLISKLDAINQELTETQVSDINTFLSTRPDQPAFYILFLLLADDAMKGVISYTPGDSEITYT